MMNRTEALRTLARYGFKPRWSNSGIYKVGAVIVPRGFDVPLLEIDSIEGRTTSDVSPFVEAIHYLMLNPPPERKPRRRKRR